MKIFKSLLASLTIYYHHAMVEGMNILCLQVTVPSGAQIMEYSGSMVVPPLVTLGGYAMGPMLSASDVSAQDYLWSSINSTSGSWSLATNFHSDGLDYPFQTAFDVYSGQLVAFDYVLTTSDWTMNLTDNFGRQASSHYQDQKIIPFTQAIFNIRFDDTLQWNFGDLVFYNVIIIVEGTSDTSWCTNGPANCENVGVITHWIYLNPKGSMDNGNAVCSIEVVILQTDL